jgi:hypothetical protein
MCIHFYNQYFIQIYPVSEGYLRKIPVERRGEANIPVPEFIH